MRIEGREVSLQAPPFVIDATDPLSAATMGVPVGAARSQPV